MHSFFVLLANGLFLPQEEQVVTFSTGSFFDAVNFFLGNIDKNKNPLRFLEGGNKMNITELIYQRALSFLLFSL